MNETFMNEQQHGQCSSQELSSLQIKFRFNQDLFAINFVTWHVQDIFTFSTQVTEL